MPAAHDDDARLGDHGAVLVIALGDEVAEAAPGPTHDLDRLVGLSALEATTRSWRYERPTSRIDSVYQR